MLGDSEISEINEKISEIEAVASQQFTITSEILVFLDALKELKRETPGGDLGQFHAYWFTPHELANAMRLAHGRVDIKDSIAKGLSIKRLGGRKSRVGDITWRLQHAWSNSLSSIHGLEFLLWTMNDIEAKHATRTIREALRRMIGVALP
nr:hypothetical protein [Candidatus Sigynarchaeota archaeon]